MLMMSSNRTYTKFQKYYLFADFLIGRVFRGTYLIDYIQYKFYDRNRLSRESFIEYQKLHKLIDEINDHTQEDIFHSKSLFNQKFNDFLERDWIKVNPTSMNDLDEFLSNNHEFIVKPDIGSFGEGVKKFTSEEFNAQKLTSISESNNIILEEVIKQHPKLAQFNVSSINTIRVVTLINRFSETEIMAAVIRLGREGIITDNFHSNGIAAQIDIETGIVCSKGIDRNFQKYVLHPDSKVSIVGFVIPQWNLIKETAIKLSKVIPEVRYVGWDITVNDKNQVVCIEGNYSADPDVTQTVDQTGKYFDFRKRI